MTDGHTGHSGGCNENHTQFGCPKCLSGSVHLEGWDTDSVVVCNECDFFQTVTERNPTY